MWSTLPLDFLKIFILKSKVTNGKSMMDFKIRNIVLIVDTWQITEM